MLPLDRYSKELPDENWCDIMNFISCCSLFYVTEYKIRLGSLVHCFWIHWGYKISLFYKIIVFDNKIHSSLKSKDGLASTASVNIPLNPFKQSSHVRKVTFEDITLLDFPALYQTSLNEYHHANISYLKIIHTRYLKWLNDTFVTNTIWLVFFHTHAFGIGNINSNGSPLAMVIFGI